MEAAEAWEKRALAQVAGLLLTRAQLRAYLDDNLGVFRQRMKEAREGDRKQYSVRACKRLGLPDKKDRGRCEVKEYPSRLPAALPLASDGALPPASGGEVSSRCRGPSSY